MSIRGGEYNTTGRYGSMYYGWRTRWVPVRVTFAPAALLAKAVNPGPLVRPVYLVEVEDRETEEVTEVPQVKSVSIGRNVEAAMDSANFTLGDMRLVSPRIAGAMQGQLQADIELWTRVSAGYRINGVDYLVRLFTGIMLDRDEDWGPDGSSATMTAVSLGYLLTVLPGVLEGHVGSLAGAVMELTDGTGLPPVMMAFTDQMYGEDEPLTIVDETLAGAFGAMFQSQPRVTWRVDAYGGLVMQEQGTGGTVWEYSTAVSIRRVRPGTSARAVVTEVSVTGATDEVSGLYTDPDLIARFGNRRGSLSSTALLTSEQVLEAGAEEVSRSARALKKLGINVPFNPFLEPLDVAAVDATSWGMAIDTNMDVLRFGWELKETGFGQTSIDGEAEDEM